MTNIFQAIPAIMAEIGAIGKDSQNNAQHYAFRSIEAVINALHPIMAAHKVFVVPIADPTGCRLERYAREEGKGVTERVIFVGYRLYSEDGSFVEGKVAGEGADFSDKATNKAMSSSLKYFLCDVFMIPTEDLAEGDRESPGANGRKQEPVGKSPAQGEPGRGAALASLGGRIAALNKALEGSKLLDDFHRDLSQAKGAEAQTVVVSQWEKDMSEKKGTAA